tara:strand:+ start:854 stop:1474 length:621 start_codon:yes stop_codon:yes gene_type:complete
MTLLNQYSLTVQKEFFHQIIRSALAHLDNSDFALSDELKQKAHDVLVVKAPNGRGNCSRAGKDSITICTTYWQIKNVISGKRTGQRKQFRTPKHKKWGHYYWNEYRSYDGDPTIGGMFVKKGDVDHGNLIQVLHELAHYVQGNLHHQDPDRWSCMAKPHGSGFKQIYACLRHQFCNDELRRNGFLALCKEAAIGIAGYKYLEKEAS